MLLVLKNIYRNNIEAYFRKAIEIATTTGMGRGCFFVNLLMAAEIPTPELEQAIEVDTIFIKTFFTEHLNRARLDGELGDRIPISAGIDALFGTTIGLFALAKTRATPIAIEAFVNNNLLGLFGMDELVWNQ